MGTVNETTTKRHRQKIVNLVSTVGSIYTKCQYSFEGLISILYKFP